jgi:hypothetical protein
MRDLNKIKGCLIDGAIGDVLGNDRLPEFYKKDLECLAVLLEIAEDLYNAPAILEKPIELISDEWKAKYIDCGR